jgi:tRNA (guanine10-N2)-dimethyltransferase
MLGERLHLSSGARVDAEDPHTIFLLVIAPQEAILGEVLWRPKRGRFLNRSPQRRPFTHPSNLTPQLATCMLNMARVREGQVVLDPFCGVGSTLMECHLLGGSRSAST